MHGLVNMALSEKEKARIELEKLSQRSKELEQTVHIVSHDLREPLVGIAGFATLLKKKCGHQLDEQGLLFLNEVIEGTKRMERKIDDLLALSRVGRSSSTHSFPLVESVLEARANMNGVVTETNTVIEFPDDLPVIDGDRTLIAQIFQNLFSNSIKYRSPDRDPVIKVEAEKDPDGCWLISVKDNGIGFDQKHSERIFRIFQRLHAEGYSGTGIGLAIVKKIVERYDGRIWAESELGVGTTFFFTMCPSKE